MAFTSNRFKLYCPAVYLDGNIINYVEKTKYLGYMFTNDKQNDVDMLRQLWLYCICDQTKYYACFIFAQQMLS